MTFYRSLCSLWTSGICIAFTSVTWVSWVTRTQQTMKGVWPPLTIATILSDFELLSPFSPSTKESLDTLALLPKSEWSLRKVWGEVCLSWAASEGPLLKDWLHQYLSLWSNSSGGEKSGASSCSWGARWIRPTSKEISAAKVVRVVSHTRKKQWCELGSVKEIRA